MQQYPRTPEGYQQWLSDKLNLWEKFRQALSPTDERLDFIAFILIDIMGALIAPSLPSPAVVSIDGRIDSLVSQLTTLNDNLTQLIVSLGGEPVAPITYRYEPILVEAATLSSKQTKDIHEAVRAETGGLIWLMGRLNSKQATLMILLDGIAWEFDLSQFVDGRVDTPYQPGVWITEESVEATTQYAFVFSGGDGLSYQKSLRIRLRNDGSTDLTLDYVKGMKKVTEH